MPEQKLMLNEKQFEVVAKLLRSKDPARTAARMVLVEGRQIKEAVMATGMFQSSVSRSVAHFRSVHELILAGYDLTK